MLAELMNHALLAGDAVATRVLGWVLTYLVHSTILIGAVWLVASRRSPLSLSEANREALWKVALVGGLLSASLQTATGVEPAGGSLQFFATARDQLVKRVQVFVQSNGDANHVGAAPPKLFVVRSLPRSMPWSLMALTLVAIASTTSLVSWQVLRRRALRSLGVRRDIRFSVTGNAMRELCQRAGIREHVSLSVSRTIGSPLALPGGEICLPERALRDFDPLAQEVVLAHELAHVVRRDAAWLDAARAIEALCFFQPLNRLARRRMQESAEYLADDWAVARTRRPLQLARCLSRVAEWVTVDTTPSAVPAMVEQSGSPLVQRVLRLTSDDRPEPGASSRLSLLAGGLALATLAVAAPSVSVGSAPLAISAPRPFALRLGQGTTVDLTSRPTGLVERNVRLVSARVATDSGPATHVIIDRWDGAKLHRTVKTIPVATVEDRPAFF